MKSDVWLVDASGRRTPDRLTRTVGSTGAQGAVWALRDRSDLIAKVVHRTDPFHLAARLRAMLAEETGWTTRNGHVAVAWPVATVRRRDDDRLVGYAAPKLELPGYAHLPVLLNRSARVRLLPGATWDWWLGVAEDLARTVHAAHQHGHVVGDLAPANLFATAAGAAALIDADGWQLRDAGRGTCLPCPFSRPEYTAPEELDQPPRVRDPASDGWALAVLAVQLLFLGFHPFGGQPEGAEPVADEVDNVRHRRCWLTGSRMRVPATAPPARLLPPLLLRRLTDAVDAGHCDPERRPRALDWAAALAHTRRRLVTCQFQPLHRYPPEAAPCPWCAMVAAGAQDPFPTGRGRR